MEKEFFDNLKELFDNKRAYKMETKLEDIDEWDSLSIISFAAMVNIKFDKELVSEEIAQAKTIKDLYLLVADGK